MATNQPFQKSRRTFLRGLGGGRSRASVVRESWIGK